MKRFWFLLALMMLGALLLTGCASSADTLNSPTPGTAPQSTGMLPDLSGGANATADAAVTAGPDASNAPDVNGGQTLEGAQQASLNMAEAVEKLSEVEEAYVVALGDTALVGLDYTKEYQGKTDDRMKKMVLTRLKTVDQTITGAAVTDNAALVTGIRALAETLKGASSLDDVNDKAEEMLKQLTVYKE